MRKIIYSLSIALMLFGSAKAQVITSGFEWQRCYGGIYNEFGFHLLKTNDNDFIVAAAAGLSYCNGEILLMNIDETGDINSVNCIVTNGSSIFSVCKTFDGGYITAGGNNGSLQVIKTDSTGTIEWQKFLGGSLEESGGSVVQLADGNYVVTGTTQSNDGDVSGNHGGYRDAWVVKLDAHGNIVWQRCIGGTGFETDGTVLQTPDLGLIISGHTSSNDGDIIGHNGFEDVFVCKLDTAGNIEWLKCYGGAFTDNSGFSGEGIVFTSDGGYAFAGSSGSNPGVQQGNAWVVKIDSIGTVQWEQNFWGTPLQYSNSIQQSGDGFIVAGARYSSDLTEQNRDAWLAKLDGNGNIEWQQTYGGSEDDIFYSVRETSDGSYIMTGQTQSDDFDISGNHGGIDIWVVKTKPLILNFDSIAAINCTGNSGYIGISVYGGTPPYSYSWDTNPIQTTEDISNLSAGVYTVTVTDAEGVTVTGSALINGPSTFNGTDLAGHFTTTVFRPGLTSQIFIDVTNQGCFPLNGTVVFVLDPWLNYVNAVPPPDSISGDSLFWNLDALTYDSLHFTPVVTVTTDLTAQIGDSVCLSLIVLPIESDGDNLQTMCYPVTNSYDPNDKQVSPQGFSEHGFIANNQRMYYTVRFQNTGNAEAINVLITDTLDANLDFQTLQVYSSSHTMTSELYPGNVVRFVFDDIHLPDSNANEPASHGYVMYEIDQLPDLAVDTEIKNTAYIYFDFNVPVITNTVLNTIYDCSSSFNEPVITASGPLTFCDGDTIVLDAGSGYDGYLWSTGATTQTLSIDTTGNYSVAVRVDTCWHSSGTLPLIMNIVEVPVSVNGELLISDSIFVTYQWYLNAEAIATATNQTYCAMQNGHYHVEVTDEYGCTGISVIIEHSYDNPFCGIGINEPENNFTIYPNPATTELTIVGYNPTSLKLFNTLGQTVAQAYNTNTLQIAELQIGLYLLQVFDNKGELVKTEKVVKE